MVRRPLGSDTCLVLSYLGVNEKEDGKMKAVVLYEPKKLIVEEVELEGPRFGEVLVKLAASGVCHSDLSRVTGSRPLPMPIVLGHEGAGIVQEVGEGVTTLNPGIT